MQKLTIYLLLVSIVGLLGYAVTKLPDPRQGGTQLSGSIDLYNTTIDYNVTVSSTVIQLLGATSSRRFFQIQNHSNIPLYCLLEGGTTVASSSVTSTAAAPSGFLIHSSSSGSTGGTYENVGYIGVVNCTASGYTSTTVTAAQ